MARLVAVVFDGVRILRIVREVADEVAAFKILVGALASALVLGPLLLYLNTGGTYYQKVNQTAFPAGFSVTENKLFREGTALSESHFSK